MTPMTTAPTALPQSTALAEAEPESLSTLFSRDPEGYTQQDLATIVRVLQEQRERWLKAAEATPGKPKKLTTTLSTPGEIGL